MSGVVDSHKNPVCFSVEEFEFQNDRLVKINGFRPEYMDGVTLLDTLRKLALRYAALKIGYDKMQSDAGWAESARHA